MCDLHGDAFEARIPSFAISKVGLAVRNLDTKSIVIESGSVPFRETMGI